jgi:acyl dehydratase
MPTDPVEWRVTARNLPEHARNAIHTDAGAQAAGFPRALVAGVTTYAYLTHPVAAAWGLPWVATGGGEVRFRRPVFDGDAVRCTVVLDGTTAEVSAVTDEPEQPRAVFRAIPASAALAPLRAGEPLPVLHLTLDGEWGSQYGSRAGDPFDLYEQHGVVHPAVWPALANQVVHQHVARGSWIHMRSSIRHHALAPVGAAAEVRSVVVRRFEAHGERAVLDVHIVVDGTVVASLEHEAIVALP